MGTEICVSTLSTRGRRAIDHHQLKRVFAVVGEVALVCAHFVLEMSHLGTIDRSGLQWTCDTRKSRSQEWSVCFCDQRLVRLTGHVHVTMDDRQSCHDGYQVG